MTRINTGQPFDLLEYMERCKHRVESILTQHLDSAETVSNSLNAAMQYGTLNGGKRFRPILIYATLDALGAPVSNGDAAACAVELVHSYSLVHDDLPAMDDDDLRRGRPTCHIAFNEATAILAGDALQSLAFEVLADTNELTQQITANQRLKLLIILAKASGTGGMAAGQALDLAAEGKDMNLLQLEQIHTHKTGALIQACTRMAAICANCEDSTTLRALDSYAAAIGLAFQVQDDILDITADTQTLGKPQGADEELAKATYPKILGLDGARQKAQALLKSANRALSDLNTEAIALHKLAEYVVNRSF